MALELSFAERRVLGVLMEKGFTTPDQYPLTLNGLVVGCNQKSCREPLSNLGEEEVLDALESLRGKGLVTLVRSVGSRTDRYKHRSGETLEIDARETAVLAELFLRGPQTDGELRQRANRMQAIDGLPALGAVLESLRNRPESYVRRLTPEGRRRGVKFAHTFYSRGEEPAAEVDGSSSTSTYEPPTRLNPRLTEPGLAAPAPSPSTATATREMPLESPPPASAPPTPGAATTDLGALRQEIDELRRENARLKERVEELESTFARFFK